MSEDSLTDLIKGHAYWKLNLIKSVPHPTARYARELGDRCKTLESMDMEVNTSSVCNNFDTLLRGL